MYKYTHGLLLQIKVSEAYAKWAGKRLPKADEWMAAAGAGKWPWGGSSETGRANTREAALGKTESVGKFPKGKSAAGCMDMAGNVMEWCRSKGGKPVCLGGSWRTFLYDAKTASQHPFEPTARDDHVGFRCVEDK